jgi:type VI protein secretion system component VasF
MFNDVEARYAALEFQDQCIVLGFARDQLGKARSCQQTADSLAADLMHLPEYLRSIAQDYYAKMILDAAHSRQKQTDITFPD